MTSIYVLVTCATLYVMLVSAYHGPDLPPGPYCGLGGRRGGCCRDRKDDCSHPILDTLCYCDEFCKKVGQGVRDDCCPDYESFCLNEAPAEIHTSICTLGHKRNKNSNDVCYECECTMVNGQPDWKCDRTVCLMSNDVVRGVKAERGLWRAVRYPEFENRTLGEGMLYKLGTLPLKPETLGMGVIHYNKDIPYPNKFDARKRWPRYVSEVRDQGWCGSDWALTIAGITSDRLAISTDGAEIVPMSPQSLLSCGVWKNKSEYKNNCKGGHLDVAWNYVSKYGLVDDDCLPYEAKVTECRYDAANADLVSAGCRAQVDSRTDRYHVSVPYKLDASHSEKDVMYELMNSGPVHAIMTVRQDFFHYRDGIYRHSQHGDQRSRGLHSVKIIGWGEDRGTKYWIAANTWGKQWGENGYFRILRGSNESGIESFIVAALSSLNSSK